MKPIDIILLVAFLAAVIGFSAWWKGRLMGQGKIMKRPSDFVEYAEIFTIRPIPNEQYAAALKALDLKNTGVALSGNTGKVLFKPAFRGQEWYDASLTCVEQTGEKSVYRFEFGSWKVTYGKPAFDDQMNMLLTLVEKMFVQLDPNAQVSTIKNEIERKHSIL